MKSIHISIVLIFLFCSLNLIAQEWKLITRENDSIIKDARQLLNIKKSKDLGKFHAEIQNLEILTQLINGKLTAKQFLKELTASAPFYYEMQQCISIHENNSLCLQLILNDYLIFLRAINTLDDVACLILKAHIDQNKKQLQWLKNKNLDLTSYFLTLNQVEKSYLKNHSIIQPAILSQRSFRLKHPIWGKITPRQELYLNYNLIEIRFMAKLLVLAQERILAHSAFIAWDFDGDGIIDEKFQTPESWKYDMALNILDFTIEKETLSQGLLANQQISKQQLLMAASELGLVNEQMIKEMITLPDFKKIKSPKAEMYIRALWSVGKTAIAVVPGGIYFILPIVLIETMVENHLKKKQDKPRVF
jgi:hypothetical protein